jgi:hypothetical protein
MGQCLSGGRGVNVNADIEDELRRTALAQRNEIKLLLLGAGESGKSTLFKRKYCVCGCVVTNECV